MLLIDDDDEARIEDESSFEPEPVGEPVPNPGVVIAKRQLPMAVWIIGAALAVLVVMGVGYVVAGGRGFVDRSVPAAKLPKHASDDDSKGSTDAGDAPQRDASGRIIRAYFAQGGAQLQERPETITPGNHVLARQVIWSSWGGTIAQGRGTSVSNDCTPSCAEGTMSEDPVNVVLRDPRVCGRGKLVYTTLVVDGKTQSVDPMPSTCPRS